MNNTIIKELALELANNFREIKLIEILYSNGEVITGQVDRVPEDPMHIYLQKRIVKSGDDPIHKLDYQRLTKATITYYQKGIRVFQ